LQLFENDQFARHILSNDAYARIEQRCGPMTRPDIPGALETLSLWLASACPLNDDEKLAALRGKDTLARLRTCLGVLSDARMQGLTLNARGYWRRDLVHSLNHLYSSMRGETRGWLYRFANVRTVVGAAVLAALLAWHVPSFLITVSSLWLTGARQSLEA